MPNNSEHDDQLIEKLAEAVHNLFCEEMKANGYTYGHITDENKKQHSALLPYTVLPEDEKEQNRDNVRDIPNKLGSLGYELIPAGSHQASGCLSKVEIEKLSQEEHKRWLKQKIVSGWKYAPETDTAKKLHKDMVPWEQLSEAAKDKDRLVIRGIPKILKKAGYVMGKNPTRKIAT
jgi:hypothetical protein